ncbi:MAG TPA: hypothetical protein PKB15_06555 [Acidimicrobiia bacterium]|nr:hypothetical protein [Acidimicrobiia bacterium]
MATTPTPTLDEKYYDPFKGMDQETLYKEISRRQGDFVDEQREIGRLAKDDASIPLRLSDQREAEKYIQAGLDRYNQMNHTMAGRPAAKKHKGPPAALVIGGIATFPVSLIYFVLPGKTKEALKEKLRIFKADNPNPGAVQKFLSSTGGKIAAGVAVATLLAVGVFAFNPKQEIQPIDPERPAQPGDVAGLPPSEQLPPTTAALPAPDCVDLEVDLDVNGRPDVVEAAALVAGTALAEADAADASVSLTDEQFEEGVTDTTKEIVNGQHLRDCAPVIVDTVVPDVVREMIHDGSIGRGL